MPPKPLPLATRFWRHVDKTGSCWNWTAYRVAAGYGKFMLHNRGAWAHRLAWELTNGPIPAGLAVCHTCDNRACVNPSHMFLGTQADNIADCVSKRRKAIGEKCGSNVLRSEQVVEIRTLLDRGFGQRIIAERFGVQQTTVSAIATGKTWRHTRS